MDDVLDYRHLLISISGVAFMDQNKSGNPLRFEDVLYDHAPNPEEAYIDWEREQIVDNFIKYHPRLTGTQKLILRNILSGESFQTMAAVCKHNTEDSLRREFFTAFDIIKNDLYGTGETNDETKETN